MLLTLAMQEKMGNEVHDAFTLHSYTTKILIFINLISF